MTRANIVTSRWVFPISRPAIEDGGVVIAEGRIIDIGPRQEMLSRYPYAGEISCAGVLLPGLVNAHIHLELSHLRDIPEPSPHQDFTEWIADLLAKKATDATSREERLAAADALLHDQHASGVILLADTGNDNSLALDTRPGEGTPEILRMLEFLAPDRAGCEAARQAIENLDEETAATGHAPYSTSPGLLQLIKRRCRRLRQIFSIHTAETNGELPFLQHHKGIFRDFLERRNRWDGTFATPQPDCTGTIDYYDRLHLLDDRTLLVHCVHVTDHDLHLAAEHDAHICLCPGSNRFLKVGQAPVEKMIAAGLRPALGTDSAASNPALDLWREMRLLAEDHPTVSPAQILAMATMGGARALHFDDSYGSLEPGRQGRLLHVSVPGLPDCRTSEEVLRRLVCGGRPADISWVSDSYPTTSCSSTH